MRLRHRLVHPGVFEEWPDAISAKWRSISSKDKAST